MDPVICPSCGGKVAPHFAKCPHCNAARAQAGSAGEAPKPAVAFVARPQASPVRESAPVPSDPVKPKALPSNMCPVCRGMPGTGEIRIETRQYKGSTGLLRPGSRYFVRWVDVPLLCNGCSRRIEIRRYLADIVCMLPFIAAFAGLVIFDSTSFLWILGIYALYLFKWTWGLGYVWADFLLYGGDLERNLARFTPEGDSGTVRFPASIWHCVVRLGWIPAAFFALATLAATFSPKPETKSRAETPAETPAEKKTAAADPEASIADPRARARAKSAREMREAKTFLETARDIAVPVEPDTLLMKKMNVARKDISFYTVYAKPTETPSQTSYQLATGPELLSIFLKTKGADGDCLFIQGAKVALSRWQVVKVAADLPAAAPPITPVQRAP